MPNFSPEIPIFFVKGERERVREGDRERDRQRERERSERKREPQTERKWALAAAVLRTTSSINSDITSASTMLDTSAIRKRTWSTCATAWLSNDGNYGGLGAWWSM
jgi:hypothetical protein